MINIDFFCPRWGFESVDWKVFLRRVKRAGYAGIEWFPFGENCEYDKVIELLNKYQLRYCIVMTVIEPFRSIGDYVLKLKNDLLFLAGIGGNEFSPLFISAQTGRDFFTASEINVVLKACWEIEKKTGVSIYQETHRNKWSYAAHVVYPVLKEHKRLRLTLDASHWFCVSESYLEDQQPAVQLAIERTSHIHARVGFTQGPQVLHPALKQYQPALQQHLKIWDAYIALTIKNNKKNCTITPEFGPPPYMTTKNNSLRAMEEQWRLNLWMKNFLEKRYSKQIPEIKKNQK